MLSNQIKSPIKRKEPSELPKTTDSSKKQITPAIQEAREAISASGSAVAKKNLGKRPASVAINNGIDFMKRSSPSLSTMSSATSSSSDAEDASAQINSDGEMSPSTAPGSALEGLPDIPEDDSLEREVLPEPEFNILENAFGELNLGLSSIQPSPSPSPFSFAGFSAADASTAAFLQKLQNPESKKD